MRSITGLPINRSTNNENNPIPIHFALLDSNEWPIALNHQAKEKCPNIAES
jgi:hypothetical protein